MLSFQTEKWNLVPVHEAARQRQEIIFCSTAQWPAVVRGLCVICYYETIFSVYLRSFLTLKPTQGNAERTGIRGLLVDAARTQNIQTRTFLAQYRTLLRMAIKNARTHAHIGDVRRDLTVQSYYADNMCDDCTTLKLQPVRIVFTNTVNIHCTRRHISVHMWRPIIIVVSVVCLWRYALWLQCVLEQKLLLTTYRKS